MYYNQLSTNRSADVLETTITHDRMMQTIVSNSDYTFQVLFCYFIQLVV